MKTKKITLLKKLEKKAYKLLQTNCKKLFYKKYDIQIIENVMCNDACHFVAVFKDYLIADDNSEYLRRMYKKIESIQRLVKLFTYYQETSVIFPNYTPLVESKYLYNNVIRKQRVIDEQQNLEEYKKYLINKEKKKNKKASPLKAIENIFEQDIYEEGGTKVFDSKAYNEILNASESIKRIIFGIESNQSNNNEKDSVKELLMKIDNCENNKEKNKNKNIDFFIDAKKKLKYAAKLLCKNKNNTKSISNDKNNLIKNKKEISSSFKKNRTININININNTKNNYAMTDRPFISSINNNISHNVINNNFPPSTKGIFKEKRIIFNKKINSIFPYQLFRNSNIMSNLYKSKKKSNNSNNNSINSLQQKLIEIFNKKIKKNKSGNKNNSYNLSFGKISNTSRLRTKTKAFIINTIQSSIMHSKSKKNYSNIKSDKNISMNKRKKSKKSREKKDNGTHHKRMKSHIIYVKNSNIDNDIFYQTKKNLKTYCNIKPLLTISPSLKKRKIFEFKTMSKLREVVDDKIRKKLNKNNGYVSNNNSLRSKNNILKNDDINGKLFPYKTHNIKNIFPRNNTYNYKFKYI